MKSDVWRAAWGVDCAAWIHSKRINDLRATVARHTLHDRSWRIVALLPVIGGIADPGGVQAE